MESGIVVGSKCYKFSISAFICDAPGRAFVKGCKGHCSYYECERCIQKGVYVGRVTFPDLHAELRTDYSFANMAQQEHHVEQLALVRLGVGMVTQFPADYMHLVCLETTRKLVTQWMKGSLNVRLGPRDITKLFQNLVSAATWVPAEFARKPRPIAEYLRWKAMEYRQFLLYTGIVYLAKILPTSLYQNFLLLSVAMRVFLCPQLVSKYGVQAHNLLLLFIEHAATLYGNEMLSNNMHNLSHLYNDVEKCGPLDNISAFPFENYLYQLKKLVKKPNFPIQQVANRLAEKAFYATSNETCVTGQMKLLQKHFTGVLPRNLPRVEAQYKQLHQKDYSIKCAIGDNCFGLVKR